MRTSTVQGMDAGTWAAWTGALVAGAIGIRGVFQAGKANDNADAALKLARQADQRAETGEARAERAERISMERSDVEWKRNLDVGPCVLSYVNIGTDPAINVELVITLPGGGRRIESFARVEAGEPIGHQVLSSVFDEAIAELAADKRFVVGRVPVAVVDLRLTWESEAGKPDFETATGVEIPVK